MLTDPMLPHTSHRHYRTCIPNPNWSALFLPTLFLEYRTIVEGGRTSEPEKKTQTLAAFFGGAHHYGGRGCRSKLTCAVSEKFFLPTHHTPRKKSEARSEENPKKHLAFREKKKTEIFWRVSLRRTYCFLDGVLFFRRTSSKKFPAPSSGFRKGLFIMRSLAGNPTGWAAVSPRRNTDLGYIPPTAG